MKVYAKETSEAFILKLYDKKIKIVSPELFKSSISVIIENKSNSKMIGKVIRGKGEVLKFFALIPEEHGVLETTLTTNQRLFYVPVSPAFQTIELSFGKDAYEIPPQP